MPFLLCIFTLFFSCGQEKVEAHFEKAANVKISEKLTRYCELSQPIVDSRGGWAVDECDGLLFSSLRTIACGGSISAFESGVEPGQWFRNPKKDCFIADKVGEQGSDSTISKDMYLGLTAALLHAKDALGLRRTIEYGKANNWIVGEAKDNITLISKCLITPSLQSLLVDAYNSVGGSLTDIASSDDAIGISSGFRAHLDVLAILVKSKIDGKIGAFNLAVLKEQAKRQPNNALFQVVKSRYGDGDFSKAEELLLDENHWPDISLPTTSNHCSNYLYQRDEDDLGDWGPCTEIKTHDATDWLFAAAVYLGKF